MRKIREVDDFVQMMGDVERRLADVGVVSVRRIDIRIAFKQRRQQQQGLQGWRIVVLGAGGLESIRMCKSMSKPHIVFVRKDMVKGAHDEIRLLSDA